MARRRVWLVHDGVAAPIEEWLRVGFDPGDEEVARVGWWTVDARGHDEALDLVYDQNIAHTHSDSTALWQAVSERRGGPLHGTAPKGTPTDLNLWVLNEVFKHAPRVPNQLKPTNVPHIRRCLKAGLLEVQGRELVLTLKGAEALVEWRLGNG